MDSREIELIESTIKHGRIYFPIDGSEFFPTDSLGDREGDGHKGVPVRFIAGDFVFHTDIRKYSAVRLSPRDSFAAYLKSVQAGTGDLLHVARVADREYKVEFKPK